MTLRDDFAAVGMQRLHYVACGPDNAPLLLFLHGFPEHCRAWQKVMPELADRWHCVAIDLPGYNLSDKPTDLHAYRVGAVARVVRTVVHAVGYERCVVVGHDWGGAIGWYLAAKQPDLVAGFVAINAVHPTIFAREFSRNLLQRQASEYIELFRRPGAEDRLAEAGFTYLFDMLGSSSAVQTWLSDQTRTDYLDAWTKPGALTGSLAYYRASAVVADAAGSVAPDSACQQMTVAVPTLVIWGDRDKFLLPGNLSGLEQFVPRLRIERIADASHWVVHEHPSLVAWMIREFANGIDLPRQRGSLGN